MSEGADRIEGADRVLRVLGKWPSFHDAEVLELTFDREGADGPSLEMTLHVFEMTAEVSPVGNIVLKNHTLVTLRFLGVAVGHLRGFNGQNVLFDLEITPLNPDQHDGRRIGVRLLSSYGLGGDFECLRCVVRDVQPYDVAT